MGKRATELLLIQIWFDHYVELHTDEEGPQCDSVNGSFLHIHITIFKVVKLLPHAQFFGCLKSKGFEV